jgi:hypothetical protein
MKEPNDHDTLRRRMGEVAALDADDPERRAVEREINNAGFWAGNEWRLLLQENSALRRELQEVSVPPGLEERLLVQIDAHLPEAMLQNPRRTGPKWLSAAIVLAACAVLSVLLWATRIRQTSSETAGVGDGKPTPVVPLATDQELPIVPTEPMAQDRPAPIARSLVSRRPTTLLPINDEPRWLGPRLQRKAKPTNGPEL